MIQETGLAVRYSTCAARRGAIQRVGTTLVVAALSAFSLAAGAQQAPTNAASFYLNYAQVPALQGQVALIQTPNPAGHPEFQQSIRSAKSTITMVMYHLTDKAVMQELGTAVQRGVQVRVIVDGGSLKNAGYKAAFQEIAATGAQVRASTQAFSLTHQKSLVVDNALALVTAINLTRSSTDSRDFGIETNDPGVIAEMNAVFETDWSNSQTQAGNTPALSDANLAWSPVSSADRLEALIRTAQHTIISTVENMGDDGMIQAFSAAAARGVQVRVMLPQCDLNPNPAFNIPGVRTLVGGGVDARVMPSPSSPEVPYMHSKMIVVDGQAVYVGSINFSYSSLNKSRELGIIFGDQTVASQITTVFESDWTHAIQAPAQNANCATPFGN